MHITIALVVAGLAGEGRARYARLPRITGYSPARLLLGPAGFG